MKRAPDSKPTKVFVAGVGLRGSGYPNAWNTIRILRAQDDFEVIECGKWLPEEFRLWRFNKQPRLKAALQFAGLLAANALSVVQLRSEEHTSELQSLMRLSYAVFCLKKKT